MYKTTGNKSVPLMMVGDGGWVKDQVVRDLFIRKSSERDHAGKQEYNKGDGKHTCNLNIS